MEESAEIPKRARQGAGHELDEDGSTFAETAPHTFLLVFRPAWKRLSDEVHHTSLENPCGFKACV
jgi:hypothetical protein